MRPDGAFPSLNKELAYLHDVVELLQREGVAVLKRSAKSKRKVAPKMLTLTDAGRTLQYTPSAKPGVLKNASLDMHSIVGIRVATRALPDFAKVNLESFGRTVGCCVAIDTCVSAMPTWRFIFQNDDHARSVAEALSIILALKFGTAGAAAMSQMEQRLLRAWDVADEDRSGGLDANEMSAALAWLGKPQNVQELRRVFEDFDDDRKGVLGFADFCRLADHVVRPRILRPMFRAFGHASAMEGTGGVIRRDGLQRFWRLAQGEHVKDNLVEPRMAVIAGLPGEPAPAEILEEDFMSYVADTRRNSWLRPEHEGVFMDMNQPLHHYYIACANAAAVCRPSLRGALSLPDTFRHILRTGARALQLDVRWNHASRTVELLSGKTAHPLRDVLGLINDEAFPSDAERATRRGHAATVPRDGQQPYPLILVFEYNVGKRRRTAADSIDVEVQAIVDELIALYSGVAADMAAAFAINTQEATDSKSTGDKGKGAADKTSEQATRLCTFTDAVELKGIPSPERLRGKVLACMSNDGLSRRLDSDQLDVLHTAFVKAKAATHSSMLDAFFLRITQRDDFGIFASMHDVALYGTGEFANRVEERPAHVQAMSRRQFVHTFPQATLEHVDESDDAIALMRNGVQLGAVNWIADENARAYRSLFAVNGGLGYLLKPLHLRHDGANAFPAEYMLCVTVLGGLSIPPPADIATSDLASPFVTVVVRGTDAGSKIERRTEPVNDAVNPDFGETKFYFRFSGVETAVVTIRVSHFISEHVTVHIGEATIPFSSLRVGYRAVPLQSCDTLERLEFAKLMCHFHVRTSKA